MTLPFEKTFGGMAIGFRLLSPSDSAALVDFYEHLSRETRMKRFQVDTSRVSPERVQEHARSLCELVPHQHVAVVASHQGALVGVARFAREKSRYNVAEMAVVVRDDYQNMGIGSQLMELARELAVADGIEHFYALVLASNQRLLNFLKRVSLHIETHSSQGQTEVFARISPSAGPLPPPEEVHPGELRPDRSFFKKMFDWV